MLGKWGQAIFISSSMHSLIPAYALHGYGMQLQCDMLIFQRACFFAGFVVLAASPNIEDLGMGLSLRSFAVEQVIS